MVYFKKSTKRNKMKTILNKTMVLVIGLTLASPSLAEEKRFDLPSGDAVGIRAELGVGYYFGNFDEQNSSNGSDISFSYNDLTLGTTYFHDRFFLDGYIRTAINTIGSDWTDNDTGQSIDTEEDLTRWEVNITGGYQISEKVSTFLGVRYASTDAKQQKNGNFGFNDNFELKTYGITTGLKGGWVSGKHVFALSGGLVYSKGDIKRSTGFSSVSAKSDSLGVMLGTQYRYLYSDKIDFSLSMDAYHLDFGTIKDNRNREWDISEETVSVRLGVNYTF